MSVGVKCFCLFFSLFRFGAYVTHKMCTLTFNESELIISFSLTQRSRTKTGGISRPTQRLNCFSRWLLFVQFFVFFFKWRKAQNSMNIFFRAVRMVAMKKVLKWNFFFNEWSLIKEVALCNMNFFLFLFLSPWVKHRINICMDSVSTRDFQGATWKRKYVEFARKQSKRMKERTKICI